MTVNAWPDHLLSLAEWAALPEDPSKHIELAEGVLVVAPRPAPQHQIAASNLAVDLNRQLPDTLIAAPDVEVVIEAGFPATVRAPDVLVMRSSVYRRNPPRIDAGDVLLAVEIISLGSRGTDRITKLAEYAVAGIPHYWVIDLTPPATLTMHTLVDGRYELTEKATGPTTVAAPATIAVDVSRVTDRDYAWRNA